MECHHAEAKTQNEYMCIISGDNCSIVASHLLHEVHLGQSWDISAELFQKLPEMTCRMYVPTNATSVNDLQYQFFLCSTRRGGFQRISPCEDCLFMHVLHATTRLQFRGAACSAKSKGNWMNHR